MYGKPLYGNLLYGDTYADVNEEDIIGLKPDLMRYLPYYYQTSELTIQIQQGFESEIGRLEYFKQDLIKQFFISTATWGLRYWEYELGIPYNPQMSLEDRRVIIISRLRGRGTTTKEMIKNTAESFSGGNVDIIENIDDYSFVIKFVGVIGIPPNMKSFIDMIEIIKPAHLNYKIEYTYTTCGMLIRWTTKCDDIKDITCLDLKSYKGGEI